MKQILETDGDVFTTMWMYLMLLNYTLKMAKTADFMLSHLTTKKRERENYMSKHCSIDVV